MLFRLAISCLRTSIGDWLVKFDITDLALEELKQETFDDAKGGVVDGDVRICMLLSVHVFVMRRMDTHQLNKK